MLIPNRDLDVDDDDPAVVLPWWAILSILLWLDAGAPPPRPVAAIAALFSRPKRQDALFVDPIEAASGVRDGEGAA